MRLLERVRHVGYGGLDICIHLPEGILNSTETLTHYQKRTAAGSIGNVSLCQIGVILAK